MILSQSQVSCLLSMPRSRLKNTYPLHLGVFFFAATLLVVSLCPLRTTASPKFAAPPDFRIFDAMRFTNRPDFRKYGIKPIRVIYTAQIWPGKVGLDNMPPVGSVLRLAESIRAHQDRWGDLVILDVEHWRLRGNSKEVSANINKYESLLSMFRNHTPGFRFGYYGTAPVVDFARAHQRSHPRHAEWMFENSRLQSLAENVDALFPSLYARRKNISTWTKFARAQISEARKYSPAKPVYVFLMPQYHPSARRHPEELIDATFWRVQLETAAKLADGIVLWGGKNLARSKPLAWNENSPWWRVTKEFLGIQRAP